MQRQLSLVILFIAFFNIYLFSQAQISFNLNFTDGRLESRNLLFGIDPTASDGIDTSLGENFLPPFPPLGVFEAQIFLPENNFNGTLASYSDFRNGSSPFSGTIEHRVKYQRGEGDSILIIYSLPQQISCNITDIITGTIINETLTGSGSFLIPNPDAIDRVKLLVTYTNATDVEDEKLNPNDFNLSQNYPNPFNPSTTIKYTLGEAQFVSLKVYDVLGKEIATLVNEEVITGSYNVSFNANGLSSGIYFYSLTAGEITQTKSMMLLK